MKKKRFYLPVTLLLLVIACCLYIFLRDNTTPSPSPSIPEQTTPTPTAYILTNTTTIPETVVAEPAQCWIAGRCTDYLENPVTNVSVHYQLSNSSWTPVRLQFTPDGSYLSPSLQTGLYNFTFDHYTERVSRTADIMPDETCILDIAFVDRIYTLTGTVYDAISGDPIPNVAIRCGRITNNFIDCTPYTDSEGRFILKYCNNLWLHFTHPDYAPAQAVFYRAVFNRAGLYSTVKVETNVFMSPACTVRVTVIDANEQVCSNVTVSLHDSIYKDHPYRLPAKGITDSDGICLFTNIPLHSSPVFAMLPHPMGFEHMNITSTQTTLLAGIQTDIILQMPEYSSLTLQFSALISGIDFRGKLSHFHGSTWTPTHLFGKKGGDYQEVTYDNLVTGKYQLQLVSPVIPSLNTNFVLHAAEHKYIQYTNFVLHAAEHKYIQIPVNTSIRSNSISGTVFDTNESPLLCRIIRITDSSGNRVYPRQSTGSGFFKVNCLYTDTLYSIQLLVCNITNILLANISPNGPVIDLRLQPGFKITGTVRGTDGIMLEAQLHIINSPMYDERVQGPFVINSVFPGRHTLRFSPIEHQHYTSFTTNIIVSTENIDIGEIQLQKK